MKVFRIEVLPYFILFCFWLSSPPWSSAEAVNLTRSPSSDRLPRHSPDGKSIAWASDRRDGWQIFVMDLAGTEVKSVTEGPRDSAPAWSPDGRRLVFERTAEKKPTGLAMVELGSLKTQLLDLGPGSGTMPDWSPDGQWIAFVSDRSGTPNLYKVRADGEGAVVALTTGPYRSLWPRWSPDGRNIAFFSRRDTNGDHDEIYLYDTVDGAMTRLTHEPGHDFCPSWSPDGRRLVFARGGVPERELRIVSIDGALKGRFGKGFERINQPSWSPDGETLLFSGRRAGVYDIYAVDRTDMTGEP